MKLQIGRFRESDLDTVFALQRAAYRPLYEKYRDDDTNPYMESRESVLAKYTRPGTQGYIFLLDGEPVGAVRVILRDEGKSAKISALCVLPACQGRGVAQEAMKAIEGMYPEVTVWRLDTIAQEAGNCHLYEKLGYVRTGRTEQVNDRLTLVFYEKTIP